MYKKLFASLLLFTTAFLFAQEPNAFDDVVEIGNLFEHPLNQSNKIQPDAGILFDNVQHKKVQHKKIFTESPAGILESSTPFKYKFPKLINTIDKLKNINVTKTMMHEVSVAPHLFVKAVETLFAPSKIDNENEKLENDLKFMQKHEAPKYRKYLCYVIKSLQSGQALNNQIGKELRSYVEIEKKPFVKVTSRHCVRFFLFGLMFYRFLL